MREKFAEARAAAAEQGRPGDKDGAPGDADPGALEPDAVE